MKRLGSLSLGLKGADSDGSVALELRLIRRARRMGQRRVLPVGAGLPSMSRSGNKS
jgi:hypothetical protein